MNVRLLASLLLLIPLAVPIRADEPETPAQFAALKYRSLGPAAGGRTTRACGVPGDPLTFYVAAASGGVWKSTDGGVNFKPVFDGQSTSSIGSIAIAPSDPNVVYVGTGEANIRGNVAAGNGIYRSNDGGKTWKHVWQQIGHIGQMAVHPRNADVAYAAVLGHAFGPNPERGIYRTVDGGKSWERVLFKDVDTGASDVAIDPNNPRIVYAGLWQARRKPWEMTSGGPGSGLYVSRDGGDTWDQIGPGNTSRKKKADADKNNGLPAGPWGKVCVAVARSDSDRLYAMIEAENGGLYRSDDGGDTWFLASGDRKLRQRAWYFSTITVHPHRADVVYCPQVVPQRSLDGGRTFKDVKGFSHLDHHDLWIDPSDPRRMISAHDGGVDISTDGGKTWRSPPLPIAQFYHIACDNSVPYRVLGCMQDMGSASGPSRSSANAGILLSDWHTIGGGEAGYAVPDPRDPNIVYAGEYSGYISRYDHRTRQARNISIYPFVQSGHGAEAMKYRFQWTSPIVVSQHEPKTVYHAANVLFRTTNGGQTWEKVSGDLTRNDRNKQKWSGGPITGDNTGVEVYGTIFSLAESPVNKKVLWAGSDDGLVHVSRDTSYTWRNVTANVPDLPDWGTIACIEASPFDEATAYLVVDAHRLDDYRPHVWKTTDFGQTWIKINADLPTTEYARVIRVDPRKKGHLFLGTERRVWHSTDDGESWSPLQLNMPTVPISDLVVKNDDLVVGTQGRSIWVLDDITPLREWTEAIEKKAGHVFGGPAAVRWRTHGAVTDHLEHSTGENPPDGAVITYYLKNKASKPIVIEVFNDKNVRIARIEGASDQEKRPIAPEDDDPEDENGFPKKQEIPGEAGINRFAWDMRHDRGEVIPKAIFDFGDTKYGPQVSPGTYTVKLLVDGKTFTGKVEVKLDPRVTEPRGTSSVKLQPQVITVAPRVATDEEIARLAKAPWIMRRGALDLVIEEAKEQEQLALRLRDDVSKVTKLVLELRSVRKQLESHPELVGNRPNAKAYLKQGKELADKLNALEEKLHNPRAKIGYDILAQRGGAKLYSQLGALFNFVADGDGPPTQGMREFAEELQKELDELVGEMDRLKAEDITRLNELARKQNLPMIWMTSPKR